MTYKGKEIEIPTFEQFQKIVAETCGKMYSPRKMYKSLDQRKWKKSDGTPINDLERTLKGMKAGNAWEYYTKETQEKIKESKRIWRERKLKPTIQKIASDKETPFSPYNEQLKDPRWKAFRQFIFAVRGCKCEMCDADNHLQVHHPTYRKNAKAWEYTCNEVVVLCERCHRQAHGLPY